MTVLYVDPSALVRAYLPDEPEHELLSQMLFEGSDGVATSELSRVEYASAIHAAARSGRLGDPQGFLARFDAHIGFEGRITVLALRPEPILRLACDLVSEHRLRALDAIHLAVATQDGRTLAGREELVFVTRDADQAATAQELGLSVR